MLLFALVEEPWNQEMEVFDRGSASSSKVSVVGGISCKSAAQCPRESLYWWAVEQGAC